MIKILTLQQGFTPEHAAALKDEMDIPAIGFDTQDGTFIVADLYHLPELISIANNPSQTLTFQLSNQTIDILKHLNPDHPAWRDIQTLIHTKSPSRPITVLTTWLNEYYPDLLPKELQHELPG